MLIEVNTAGEASKSGVRPDETLALVDQLPRTASGKIQKYVLRGGRAAIAAQ